MAIHSQTIGAGADPDTREFQHASALKTVYVYEAPVRIWHWINALAITVLRSPAISSAARCRRCRARPAPTT